MKEVDIDFGRMLAFTLWIELGGGTNRRRRRIQGDGVSPDSFNVRHRSKCWICVPAQPLV